MANWLSYKYVLDGILNIYINPINKRAWSMPSYLQIWVDEGDWDRAARFAFVELEPAAAAAIPAPCIRSAFLSVAPALRFRLRPSPCGVALMEFDSESEREAAMAVQPVHHRGDVVKLQRVEDTNDRFVRELAWLAHVVVWNFPEEH